MCGIAGYYGEGSKDVLQKMSSTIKHRGPDDSGELVIGKIGLAHRRLSIIDVSKTGHQPMQNRSGTISLIFNGEIYNYEELKKKFLSNYEFEGTSDTEVLIKLYEELGVSLLSEIRGMFAFALFDRDKRELILARDHFGKKPLYWSMAGETLIFGSELKALREHPLFNSEIDMNSVAAYLVHEHIPAPSTIYKSAHKLPQGSYLVFNGNEISRHTYSKIRSKIDTFTNSFEDSKAELLAHLNEAVKKRMVADVPIGVFLSGGLDSSTIAYFAQKNSATRIKTFSIGFQNKSFDESDYAKKVAQALGTEHHEKEVGSKDIKALMKEIPMVLDEPMADSSIIPTLLLSEFTSSEVKVALGGDGADELFWGYDTFYAHKIGEVFDNFPASLIRLLRKIVNVLPVSHKYMSFDFKAKSFMSGFGIQKKLRNTYWIGAFTASEVKELLNFNIDEDKLFQFNEGVYEETSSFWNNLQMDYIRGYLAEDILVKVDRASMAHGLEVRAPFLDLELARFALSLPVSYRMKGRSMKYILKEVMREKLPREIIERPKSGFNIPIGLWIKEDLRDLFEEKLLDGALVHSGLFKRVPLAKLLESHVNGKIDNRKKIWTLFVLALWMEKWYEKN